jgi:hypothetical protein
MTTTVTGLFDRYDDASATVDALERAGIPSSDISILANNDDGRARVNDAGNDTSKAVEDAETGAGVGAAVGGIGGLLTGLGLMAIPGVGPVVAAGWLAATAAGAVTGAVVGGAAGGIVGAMTEAGVPEDEAHVYAEGIRRGGTLVTAKVEDALAATARAIIAEHKSADVTKRRTDYEADGWKRFDESASMQTQDALRNMRNLPPL